MVEPAHTPEPCKHDGPIKMTHDPSTLYCRKCDGYFPTPGFMTEDRLLRAMAAMQATTRLLKVRRREEQGFNTPETDAEYAARLVETARKAMEA